MIQVEDFPDDEILEEMECESPFDLLGLYAGVDMARRSVTDAPENVDMIFLYRRPILDYWCESGDDLIEVVRHVLIHEIGHHFGFSDDDMERPLFFCAMETVANRWFQVHPARRPPVFRLRRPRGLSIHAI